MYLAVIPRDAIVEPFGLKVCWKVSGISYFFDNDLSDMKHFKRLLWFLNNFLPFIILPRWLFNTRYPFISIREEKEVAVRQRKKVRNK